MKVLKPIAVLVSTVLVLSMSVTTAAKNDRTDYECRSEGSRDISMDARYRVESDRVKFDASFEAAPIGLFDDGDVLEVYVAGILVGDMVLITQLNGDLEGDLDFDTQPDEGNPFPDNFPDVGEGTSVMIAKLGCALEED